MTWDQVFETHKTITGIFVRDGVATLVLCGRMSRWGYSDKVYDGWIEYFVGPKQDRKEVEGLLQAWRLQTTVAVFRKNGRNDWTALGDYRIASVGDPDATRHRVLRLQREAPP